MGFFKNLFVGGDNNETNQETLISKEMPQVKRTIFDFFQLDLKTSPNESFIKADPDINKSGDSIQAFRKSLNYKECGIFDTVEVIVINGTSKNIFFKSYDPKKVKIDNLKILIDSLYLIYGDDDEYKGKTTSKDIEEYRNQTPVFGRNWMDSKYEYAVMISLDEDKLSIGIWGINFSGNSKSDINK